MIIYGGNTTYNVSNEMLTYDIKGGVWKSEMVCSYFMIDI